MLLQLPMPTLLVVGLSHNSNIRPNRLFTADRGIILYKAGQLKVEMVKKVTDKIIDILK